MKIILEFESFSDLKTGVAQLMGGLVGPEAINPHEIPAQPEEHGGGEPVAEVPVKTPKAKKKGPAPAPDVSPVVEEKSPEVVEDEPVVEEVVVEEPPKENAAIEAVKEIVNTFGNKDGIPKARELMGKYGALRASEISAENLPAFLKDCKALVAKAKAPKGSAK